MVLCSPIQYNVNDLIHEELSHGVCIHKDVVRKMSFGINLYVYIYVNSYTYLDIYIYIYIRGSSHTWIYTYIQIYIIIFTNKNI